jgi:hypothetical protein
VAGPWLLRDREEGGLGARARSAWLIGLGVVVTGTYDLLTNFAQGIYIGSVPAALALAILPSAQHIASNAVIFAVVGNLAYPWLSRHPAVVGHAA